MGKANKFYERGFVKFHKTLTLPNSCVSVNAGEIVEIIKVMLEEHPDPTIAFTVKLWIELQNGRRLILREDSDYMRDFIVNLEVIPPTEMSRVLYSNG